MNATSFSGLHSHCFITLYGLCAIIDCRMTTSQDSRFRAVLIPENKRIVIRVLPPNPQSTFSCLVISLDTNQDWDLNPKFGLPHIFEILSFVPKRGEEPKLWWESPSKGSRSLTAPLLQLVYDMSRRKTQLGSFLLCILGMTKRSNGSWWIG